MSAWLNIGVSWNGVTLWWTATSLWKKTPCYQWVNPLFQRAIFNSYVSLPEGTPKSSIYRWIFHEIFTIQLIIGVSSLMKPKKWLTWLWTTCTSTSMQVLPTHLPASSSIGRLSLRRDMTCEKICAFWIGVRPLAMTMAIHMGLYGNSGAFIGIYPLVMTNIAMDNGP